MNRGHLERLKKIESDLRQIKTNQDYYLADLKIYEYSFTTGVSSEHGYLGVKYNFRPIHSNGIALVSAKYRILNPDGTLYDGNPFVSSIGKMDILKKDSSTGMYYYSSYTSEFALSFSSVTLENQSPRPFKVQIIIYSSSEGYLEEVK